MRLGRWWRTQQSCGREAFPRVLLLSKWGVGSWLTFNAVDNTVANNAVATMWSGLRGSIYLKFYLVLIIILMITSYLSSNVLHYDIIIQPPHERFQHPTWLSMDPLLNQPSKQPMLSLQALETMVVFSSPLPELEQLPPLSFSLPLH